MRELIPWTLLICTLITAYLLLERRRRSRLRPLDEWAGRHGMPLERDVGAIALAQLEPLTLVAPVVDVERLWQGRLTLPQPSGTQGDGIHVHIWLASCLTGTQHRPRPTLLGVFEAPPELPQLRVLPAADRGAPDNLGFVEMPTEQLVKDYRLEAFAALPPALIEAIGATLREAAAADGRLDWRVELRPGRLLLAAPELDAGDADRLLELASRLLSRLVEALRPPARGPLLPNFVQ